MKWKIPKCVTHSEVKMTMREIVKSLEEITINDLPILHRMATALETYYTCEDELQDQGLTMINNKKEIVKRPEVNIQRDAWLQYVNCARELGLTRKSKKQLGDQNLDNDDTELNSFVKFGK